MIESPTARPPHPLPFPRASTLAARGAVRCRFAPRAGVDGPRARAFALSPRESVPYFASDGGAPRVVVPCGRRLPPGRALKPLPSAAGARPRAARRRAGSRPTGDREGRAPSRAAAGGGWRDAGRTPDGAAPGPANRLRTATGGASCNK